MDVQAARNLMSSLFDQDCVPCRLRFWDDSEINVGEAEPAFTLAIKDPRAFDSICSDQSVGFGQAYMNGQVEVDGNLGALIGLAYQRDILEKLSVGQKARLCWLTFKNKASLKQARKDVQSHYDRGNDFYRLWLDEGMNYSCAYFTHESQTLEEAQNAKIQHILRKIQLKPGHRLLDIGCGWGSLLMAAARLHDGVRAVGLTLSERQYELGQKRIRDAGLSDRVEIRLRDYRELAATERASFDRIVSVGMFEHVGKDNVQVFFDEAARFLRPAGVMLLHTIGRIKPMETDRWIQTYIFPGGYLPALGETTVAAEEAGFDFLDLEDLRPHYDMTLGHWIDRFEAHVDEIEERMGSAFVRMWRLYLYGSQMSFRYGALRVFQLLYALGRRTDWPLTRRWVYEKASVPGDVGL